MKDNEIISNLIRANRAIAVLLVLNFITNSEYEKMYLRIEKYMKKHNLYLTSNDDYYYYRKQKKTSQENFLS